MSDPASKRLRHFPDSRIRNARLSYKGTRDVAIYAFSSGKFLNVRVYASVKDLTNIMSAAALENHTIIPQTQVKAPDHTQTVQRLKPHHCTSLYALLFTGPPTPTPSGKMTTGH